MNHGAHGDTEARSKGEGFEPVQAELNELVGEVIGAAIEVHKDKEPGLLESITVAQLHEAARCPVRLGHQLQCTQADQ